MYTGPYAGSHCSVISTIPVFSPIVARETVSVPEEPQWTRTFYAVSMFIGKYFVFLHLRTEAISFYCFISWKFITKTENHPIWLIDRVNGSSLLLTTYRYWLLLKFVNKFSYHEFSGSKNSFAVSLMVGYKIDLYGNPFDYRYIKIAFYRSGFR